MAPEFEQVVGVTQQLPLGRAGTDATALEPAGTADLFDLAEDRFDALLAQGIAGLALWAGQPSPPTPQPRPSHLAGRLHTGSGGPTEARPCRKRSSSLVAGITVASGIREAIGDVERTDPSVPARLLVPELAAG